MFCFWFRDYLVPGIFFDTFVLCRQYDTHHRYTLPGVCMRAIAVTPTPGVARCKISFDLRGTRYAPPTGLVFTLRQTKKCTKMLLRSIE